MSCKQRCNSQHYSGCNERSQHQRRGPSSYSMHDPELIFHELKLKEGDSFLDLGCGAGDYSVHAAKIVGNSGVVFALDVWEALLDGLAEEAVSLGLRNIRTKVSDISKPLLVEDNCIDVCFIATVLHTLNLDQWGEQLFNEIHRVLKSEGRLVIIECKKEDRPFGPPMHLRISQEELEAEITQYGFKKLNYVDLGHNYMIQFAMK